MKKDYWLDVRDLWPESIAALISTKKSFFTKLEKKSNHLYIIMLKD